MSVPQKLESKHFWYTIVSFGYSLLGIIRSSFIGMDISLHVHPWHNRRHHERQRFANIWNRPERPPAWQGARWFLRHGLRSDSGRPAPVHVVPPERIQQTPDRLRITWLGHATLLVQTPRHTLLTDPMFGRRASPVPFAGPRRLPVLPIRIEELPPVDVVLLSHDHYDHLDKGSITALQQSYEPLFLTPLGVGQRLRQWGASRVAELDWWQYAEIDGARYHCTPARHSSGRSMWGQDTDLWASWYIEPAAGSMQLFFAGDSAYAPHFTEIRRRLGSPDVAFLPIGGYEPDWLMGPVHMDPREAAQAFEDLAADCLVPIHWGTFDLSGELLHEPPARLRDRMDERGVSEKLYLLDIGRPLEWKQGALFPRKAIFEEPVER